MEPYNPIVIANYFIQKSFDSGKELTPMKLVKLVYIAHGWHLALKNEPLINEGVQAWKYGPVINSLYHYFKPYGNNQISAPGRVIGLGVRDPDDETKAFLDKIWEVYGDMNGLELSTLTHQQNTPWDIVWNTRDGKNVKAALIGNEIIKEHYKTKINVPHTAVAVG
jgi:uncharacterized phage-associated protein